MNVNTKNFRIELALNKVARLWLAGILLILLFQRRLGAVLELSYDNIGRYLSYADELTIAVFLFFAIREFFKHKKTFDFIYFILLLPILLFSISAFLSGRINGNTSMITMLGIFDYVKNILVIFIYAAFFKDPEDFKKIFRFILLVTALLGVISFIQEFWAMYSRYVMGKNIMDINYLFVANAMPENSWRFGIYKAPSIIHNSNNISSYALLILSIYLCVSKKINYAIVFSVLSGIVFSASRRSYVGLIIVAVLLMVKHAGLRMFLVISVLMFCFFSMFWDFNIEDISNISQPAELNHSLAYEEAASDDNEVTHDIDDLTSESDMNEGFFREYTRKKGIEIWSDYPMFGIGPGMFGGIISIKTYSHLYENYNILPNIENHIFKWSGIDQYWPQVLAETGMVGFLNMVIFFILLCVVLFVESQRSSTDEMKGYFYGLMIYLAVVLVFTLGSGLNFASIVFTYFAFVGMAFGCRGSFRKTDEIHN